MASLTGKSSNPELNTQAAEELFGMLEEWNDYLERHVAFYCEAEILVANELPTSAIQDSTEHRGISQTR